jgi:hypothetical protein
MLRQNPIADNDQILCVVLLRRAREVEAASDHRHPVNDNDLRMRDRWLLVDQRPNSGIRQKRRAAIAFAPLALI